MVLLSEVVSLAELDRAIEDGYVSRKLHPEYPYAILNYTPKAQFENRWDAVTMNCRGLIYEYNSGEVIARGMPKFFNLGQPGAPEFSPDDLVHVADKVDGSLGILYRCPDGSWAVATRGSFVSEQALHATEWVGSGAWVAKTPGWSQVVEIVYPENRIVVDYGERDELVPLGLVKNATGSFMPWPLSNDQRIGEMTFADALALPQRDNAEGLVLTRVADGAMVKVKQGDYLRLHKAIFGLSARRIWEWMVEEPDKVDEYIAALPDEFQQWAKDKATELELQVDVTVGWLHDLYADTLDYLDATHGEGEWTKKDFALEVNKDSRRAWAMFMLYDGKDVEPKVWKQIKPEAGDSPVRQRTEDEA